jgi:hypothetical protein
MSGRFKPARQPREAKEFRRVALDALVPAGKSAADGATASHARFGRRGVERRRGERRA